MIQVMPQPVSAVSLPNPIRVELLRVVAGRIDNPIQVVKYTISYPALIVQQIELFDGWESAQKGSSKNCFVDVHSTGVYRLGQHVKIPALGLLN